MLYVYTKPFTFFKIILITLDIQVAKHEKMNPIAFEDQRSKVNVTWTLLKLVRTPLNNLLRGF